jgi:hypothetical protein
MIFVSLIRSPYNFVDFVLDNPKVVPFFCSTKLGPYFLAVLLFFLFVLITDWKVCIARLSVVAVVADVYIVSFSENGAGTLIVKEGAARISQFERFHWVHGKKEASFGGVRSIVIIVYTVKFYRCVRSYDLFMFGFDQRERVAFVIA